MVPAVLLFVLPQPIVAQVSNDNEDEVYKVDAAILRSGGSQQFRPGEVIVKFRDASPVTIQQVKGRFKSASISSVNQVLGQYGATSMDKLFPNEKHVAAGKLKVMKAPDGSIIRQQNLDQVYQIKMESLRPDSTLELVKALNELKEVEYAEPNYIAYISGGNGEEEISGNELSAEASAADNNESPQKSPSSVICSNPSNNPLFHLQWGLNYEGLPDLWKKPIIDNKRPIIAILDTGVDTTHPDLVDNLWTNTAEAEGEPDYDNDGNGFKGDVHGWDFINNTPDIHDYNSHGTHCAGIAAASDNDKGIIGANPKALIMPVTVMQSDGSGDYATIAKGINYAVNNGATVISMSLGGYVSSRVLRDALGNAYGKAVLVAAAGNDHLAIYPECGIPSGTCFPAGYSFVLGVEALAQDGQLAGFNNYDCDGPNYSAESSPTDPEGFNYELMAPGVRIASSVPNGKYKYFSGTSMATPLVAGAISALKMVKKYDSQEILWGDLTHSATILGAYNITDRPAELDFLGMQMRDRKELTDGEIDDNSYASNDGEVDAGETLSIYPILRTTFGAAKNIKLKIEMGDEYEDKSLVEFITPSADFGMSLSAYGKGVSKNPLKIKINPNCADARHIKMKVVATADGTDQTFEQAFTLIVSNMHKIGGLIDKDTVLTADKAWYVTDNIAIMEGATMRIEPGTRLEFAEGCELRAFGWLIAKGTPEKPIIFTKRTGQDFWRGVIDVGVYTYDPKDTLYYCKLSYIHNDYYPLAPMMFDCEISDSEGGDVNYEPETAFKGKRINFVNNGLNNYFKIKCFSKTETNFVNNLISYEVYTIPKYGQINHSNWINSTSKLEYGESGYEGKIYWLANYSYTPTPSIDHAENPSYLGTAREDLVRPYCYEIGNAPDTYGKIDLSNMRKEPVHEAHGIVWKVVVDGKDAQDEYEDLPPLGVGKHSFCVWFNRPMNINVAPQISFGVRDPYTQVSVAEDGSWSSDSTKYTAYVTITGKTASDGVNQIYVHGAEDNEFFECPYEKTRFRVQVQAAGSMATGFMAEPGLGKVTLTWNNENNNFDDAMGFNVYRINEPYQKIEGTDTIMVADTIRINQEIIPTEETSFTDYDVVAGKTYNYYYKVLSTDLREYDISNVVAATVLSSEKGDANGSGAVDVADVITTVNYSIGDRPKPFLFEAADMNEDKTIDVLDVVGIIEKILSKDDSGKATAEAVATYTVENGTLYVDCPVALAGVQVQVSMDKKLQPKVADDLKGFENASAWLSDNDYIFLAYNMNGKTLPAGKNAILNIGDADLTSLCLSDAQGHNVQVMSGTATGIETITKRIRNQKGIFSLDGRKVAGDASRIYALPSGVYIVDGEKVVK